jgi:transposase InsO family protein
MSMATPIPLEQLCRLALVSRAGFYRWRNGSAAIDRDLDLRDEIQRIALEFPFYGWPRITRELGDRGWRVNHKRVYRIMREDNLLCLRRGKFSVMTTNSNHDQPVYPNLAKAITPTGINQLWVADITYIRLELEFVYLAVILDAFSRRVIGWALDRTLEDKLTMGALRMALDCRPVIAGLVHHSDRGVQYASGAYTGLLKDNHITIS